MSAPPPAAGSVGPVAGDSHASGAYDTHRSAKTRADFPLPDVTWEPARPYYEGAAVGELRLPFCDACGATNWYPKGVCLACDATSFTWRATAGTGTVFSFVVVRHVFLPQYKDLVPFVAGLVELDDAPGARITSRITGADPADVHIGMPVVATFEPLHFAGVDGEVVAPLFRPAN